MAYPVMYTANGPNDLFAMLLMEGLGQWGHLEGGGKMAEDWEAFHAVGPLPDDLRKYFG